MYKTKLFAAALLLTAVVLNGCTNEAVAPEDDLEALLPLLNMRGPNPRPQTWVDGELFAGVVTPAEFDPASDPFDELYTLGMVDGVPRGSFRGGAPLISESKPGDQDYNGGRWHLNVLKASVPASKYANANGVENLAGVEGLDLNDFESTPNYFECPLLPRRGR